MSVHSHMNSNQHFCWNCEYWEPVRRKLNMYGDTEEQGPGECRCRRSQDYGKQTVNGHQCSYFEPWQ